jgi:maltose 6'-phosphate phosphatase
MKRITLLIVTVFILSCSSGAEKQDTPAQKPPKKEDAYMQKLPSIDITVRLYDNGYKSAGIVYLADNGWLKEPAPMKKDGVWMTVTVTNIRELRFYFQIDGAKWYPSKNAAAAYRATLKEVWIRDGIAYPYDPVKGKKPAGMFDVLTLNLHTYQEKDPLVKIGYVAEAIAKADADFIALQECAQHSSSNKVTEWFGVTIRSDNMAKIITDALKKKYAKDYNVFWDWAHYGWGVWEEGVAVMSKKAYPMKHPASQYISAQTVKTSIDSRMGAIALFELPGAGLLRLVSVHVSWGDVQSGQLAVLHNWATKVNAAPGIILICGDFNMNFDSPGYKQMTEEYGYSDAYRIANPGGKADGTTSGSRIDYQFLTAGNVIPVLAQRLFTGAPDWDAAFKQVSDHYGVLVWYKVTSDK